MKRILVISDTHRDTSRIEEVNRLAGPFDAAIHLGDCTEDAERVSEKLGIACVPVRGNCDSDYSVPDKTTVEYEGVKLLCVHGHRYRDAYLLSLEARQEQCKAALFGHTHTPCVKTDGIPYLINPGSLSRPRYGSDAGFCVLYIENGELFVKRFSLEQTSE